MFWCVICCSIYLIPAIRNATIALQREATFQAFLDDLIIWSGLGTLQRRLLFCCLSFIQNQHPHWYLCLLYDTKQPGGLFPLEVLSGFCLLLLGKAPFALWRWISNNGADSISCILLFALALGTPLRVPGCKLWMIRSLSLARRAWEELGGVCGSGLSFFFFFLQLDKLYF